jgi:hypothetical protein
MIPLDHLDMDGWTRAVPVAENPSRDIHMRHHRSLVVAIVHEREQAWRAIEDLRRAAFLAKNISLLMPEHAAPEQSVIETTAIARAGVLMVPPTTGPQDSLCRWLAAGPLSVPGLGPCVVAGLFAAPLGGVTIDADRHSLAGLLIRLGVPEGEAGTCERDIRAGRALLVVRVEWRTEEAQQILDRVGAARVYACCGPRGRRRHAWTHPSERVSRRGASYAPWP